MELVYRRDHRMETHSDTRCTVHCKRKSRRRVALDTCCLIDDYEYQVGSTCTWYRVHCPLYRMIVLPVLLRLVYRYKVQVVGTWSWMSGWVLIAKISIIPLRATSIYLGPGRYSIQYTSQKHIRSLLKSKKEKKELCIDGLWLPVGDVHVFAFKVR